MYDLNAKPLSPQQLSKARKRFEWLTSFLIVNYGFVHHVLQVMTKTVDTHTQTMGVRVLSGGRFELRYNPAFFESLTDEEAVYVFFHEVLHLSLHHCTRRKFSDHALGNIAHDLAVNELIPIKTGSCEPPRDKAGNLVGVFVNEFRKQKGFEDIENNQSAEWYYDYLKRKAPQQGGGGEGQDSQTMDDHNGWKEDELADTQVKARIDHIARNNLWGNVSATFKEAVMAAQIRRVNWRNLIRRFIGNILWKDRETTRKRPNRRTGYKHPGSKRVHVDKALVAVDTSGSIDSETLSKFLGTVNSMLDFFPIDLVQFDAGITDGPRPFEASRVKLEFSGRGGTVFGPVFELAKERHYKALIVLTDGEAEQPDRPTGIDVLWALPTGKNPPVTWGKVIHLETHA
jgi:predicted metal-dependent peptidase